MLLSLIPFAFVGLVSFMNTLAMTLCALILSGMSLLLYFGYQVWNPWIQARSLAYLKQENLRARFFYHVMRLADVDHLYDEQGNPNVACFKNIFDGANLNKEDKSLSDDKLENLIVEVFGLENDNISKEYAKAEILMNFDKNNDGSISWKEFEQGCTNWLEKWNNEANSSGSANKSIWNKFKEIAINNQRSKLSITEQIMPRILKQILKMQELVKEDGEPDREKIEGLFSQYDKDNNDIIHRDELQQFIKDLHFGIRLDRDRVLDELVNEFDDDKNHLVEKKDIVNGLRKRKIMIKALKIQ
uniref:Sodium/calcium exchanger NCL1-like n=1 Tax=Tanacetum cinerariifolium TaxID=118510 RepID=A0A699L6I8_TANCI|nr:sodium/calcium exchanger NCL1-like [Tanacetum cinerariifolium]